MTEASPGPLDCTAADNVPAPVTLHGEPATGVAGVMTRDENDKTPPQLEIIAGCAETGLARGNVSSNEIRSNCDRHLE